MGDVSRITHLVSLDLVDVHTNGELVALTKCDYGDAMLHSHICDHGGSRGGDNTTVAKNVGSGDKN